MKALNGTGESAYSNEASVEIPDQPMEMTLKQGIDGYQGCTDTYLDSSAPSTNYGNTSYKHVNSDPGVNMAVRFELPEALANRQIDTAVLTLYCWTVSGTPAEGDEFQLYELTESWDENTADWEHRDEATEWLVHGGTYALPAVAATPIQSSSFYPAFNITDMVRKWVDQPGDNNGLILVNPSSAATGIKASEYNEYGRPSLVISYSQSVTCEADMDGDGDTDGRDLALLAINEDTACLENTALQLGQIPEEQD